MGSKAAWKLLQRVVRSTELVRTAKCTIERIVMVVAKLHLLWNGHTSCIQAWSSWKILHGHERMPGVILWAKSQKTVRLACTSLEVLQMCHKVSLCCSSVCQLGTKMCASLPAPGPCARLDQRSLVGAGVWESGKKGGEMERERGKKGPIARALPLSIFHVHL